MTSLRSTSPSSLPRPTSTSPVACSAAPQSASRSTWESRPSAAVLDDLRRSYGGHAEIDFVQGSIHTLDAHQSSVEWTDSGSGGSGQLPFDRLLLAVGGRPSAPWTGQRVRVMRDAESIDVGAGGAAEAGGGTTRAASSWWSATEASHWSWSAYCPHPHSPGGCRGWCGR